eukprot:8324862-Lingulodinium_polyedra.AAC.1
MVLAAVVVPRASGEEAARVASHGPAATVTFPGAVRPSCMACDRRNSGGREETERTAPSASPRASPRASPWDSPSASP